MISKNLNLSVKAKQQSGFTLIEIILALSILSFIGLGSSLLLVNSVTMNSKVKQKSDFNDSVNAFIALIGRSAICSQNLSSSSNNLRINMSNFRIINPQLNSKIFGLNSLGLISGASIFDLNDVQLQASVSNARMVCAVDREFIADLTFTPNQASQTHFERRVPLFIKTDTSGRIESCTTNPSDLPSTQGKNSYCRADCSQTFNYSFMRRYFPYPRGAHTISSDIATTDEICRRIGCGSTERVNTLQYRSCGDNFLASYNGSNFVVINACTNQGGRFLNHVTPALKCYE